MIPVGVRLRLDPPDWRAGVGGGRVRQRALERAGMKIGDIDLYEVNGPRPLGSLSPAIDYDLAHVKSYGLWLSVAHSGELPAWLRDGSGSGSAAKSPGTLALDCLRIRRAVGASAR